MTRTYSFKKLNHLFVSFLFFAKCYNFLDDSGCNLHFKKLLVVVDEADDCFFGTNIVLSICVHGMIEVQVNPLTNIQLILIVSISDCFDQVVSSFTDHDDLVGGADLRELAFSTLEG
jgi:hypothetical protein